MTAAQKRKREATLLGELRAEHSYLMFELRLKDERVGMLSRWSGGKRMQGRPAVGIRLVVPEDSSLGREIVKMRQTKAREAAAKKAKRVRRAPRAEANPRTGSGTSRW